MGSSSKIPLQRILAETTYGQLRASARWRDDKRLLQYGFKAHSQTDEDGFIQEIFSRIGTTNKRFAEIGVQSGLECNTAYLVVQGWSGLWIEANEEHAARATQNFNWSSPRLRVLHEKVRPENINELVESIADEGLLDLLSIDVDGMDYWLWQALIRVRPRTVVIEYNATYPPPTSITIPYDPDLVWGGSTWYGASLSALEALARLKDYTLVGCSVSGVNAFFVRNDLADGSLFASPFTAENHFEPPRYWLTRLPSGHAPGSGPWEPVS